MEDASVFEWCAAFDEEGKRPEWWLARKKWKAPRWTATSASRPPHVRQVDAPFVDAERAWERLLAENVSPTKLAKHLDAEATSALAGVRTLLTTFVQQAASSDPDDLFGLHEELLSADPSGDEAGPGSWPAPPPKAHKATVDAAG